MPWERQIAERPSWDCTHAVAVLLLLIDEAIVVSVWYEKPYQLVEVDQSLCSFSRTLFASVDCRNGLEVARTTFD